MSKILIIDDDKKILNNLKYILETEGYDVTATCHGQEGINLFLMNKDIDAVVSAMEMDGLSGIDVIKAVKKQDQNVGIIIISERKNLDNAVSALKEGAFDYLGKPVNEKKLLSSIENSIKRLHLIRESCRQNEDICRKNMYFQLINEAAAQILMNMTPKKLPDFDVLKLSAIYKSCEQVGGDMYDAFELGDKIIFYLFDVCGHGILSAVMTMILKSSFNNLKFLFSQAGIVPKIEDIVQSINQEMYVNTASNLFATLITGIYDKKDNEITYISAGHVDQYLVSDKKLVTLSSTSTVIGIFQDVQYSSAKINVQPGDRLYLFTDGITEIWRDEFFSATEEIIRIIKDMHQEPLEKSVSGIYTNLIGLYKNKTPDDDITILGIEFKKEAEA